LGAFPTDHGDADEHFKRLDRFAPFAAVFNVSGQPAISLPAGLDIDGLPLGVQLGGPRGSEELLLRLAAQIEQSAPWPRAAPMAET
jgi:amidase